MQAITHIAVTVVILYLRVGYEFKIDAIPVVSDLIIQDAHTIALPAMNTICRGYLIFRIGTNDIPFNGTRSGVLAENTKEIIFQPVIADSDVAGIKDMDCGNVIVT